MTFRQYRSLNSFRQEHAEGIHLAVGMFDGIHIGHRTVVQSALEHGAEKGGEVGILTFWPHPSRLFTPTEPTRMILTPEYKRQEFSKFDLSFLIEEPFTREFSAVEADDFLNHLITRIPGLCSIHAGENWRFGKGRVGDMEQLIKSSEGTDVSVFSVKCHHQGGDRVSSTRIRDLLVDGELDQVNELLGYDYYSIGTVTQGKRLGRQIGVPTLNLPFEGDLRPRYGVYTVLVSDIDQDHWYPGVANFGVKPTVQDDSTPLLEVNLLEGCSFDYGHRLKVRWQSFLRSEQKFSGLDALKQQIAVDIERARKFFDL
ncbi:riboflavin biosynthesis protein RibF [Puniceicoccaceae bacterium K14]|nr:riboflavin biosynthesis protein RibF [Puniceicoccaceae bacterium K14]